jgi:hypothetical protein
LRSEEAIRTRAAEIYADYSGRLRNRFRWITSARFVEQLAKDLGADAQALRGILTRCGPWDASRDAKLKALLDLANRKHRNEKLIIFSQFADTVDYLTRQLAVAGTQAVAGATGQTENPTRLAWRFSPGSNDKRDQVEPGQELRVLAATDVLSEGQNLQDAAIVVNYDLPWAIIRLIQRAGRVDRIGQQADTILCYSFLPAEGVERIIRLRARVRQRLRENAEVVGTDEFFFEDDRNDQTIRDLFTERAGILDGDADAEVDLGSQAFQIWKNAIDQDPTLAKTIPSLPHVLYSTRPHVATEREPEGALVYVRTAEGNDALAWMDVNGNSVTESQFAVLKTAACGPDTPALPRLENHHDLVRAAVELVGKEETVLGGQLGRPSGARFRTYVRLKGFAETVEHELPLFPVEPLRRAVQDIYSHPLRPLAVHTLNRLLRSGVRDEELAERVIEMRDEGRLCIIEEHDEALEPQIICSLGLRSR